MFGNPNPTGRTFKIEIETNQKPGVLYIDLETFSIKKAFNEFNKILQEISIVGGGFISLLSVEHIDTASTDINIFLKGTESNLILKLEIQG